MDAAQSSKIFLARIPIVLRCANPDRTHRSFNKNDLALVKPSHVPSGKYRLVPYDQINVIGRLNITKPIADGVPEQVTLLDNDVIYVPMSGIGRADLSVKQHIKDLVPS